MEFEMKKVIFVYFDILHRSLYQKKKNQNKKKTKNKTKKQKNKKTKKKRKMILRRLPVFCKKGFCLAMINDIPSKN